MRRLLIVFGWLAVVGLLVVVFLPKASLYFLAERHLKPLGVVISGERVQDLGLGLRLKGGRLDYNDMHIADLNQSTLWLSFGYNRFELAPFELGSDLASLLPDRIERVRITHTLLMPHRIFLDAKGGFGQARGEVNLLDRNLSITLEAPGEIQRQYRQFFNQMRNTEEGFVYELAF
jgi:hypothetical protein